MPRSVADVDHHLDAAVLLAAVRIVGAVGIGIGGNRPRLAEAVDRRGCRHAVMGDEPGLDAPGAPFAQSLVIGIGTERVRMAGYLCRMVAAGVDRRREAREGRLRRIRQVGLVEGEERIGGNVEPLTAD